MNTEHAMLDEVRRLNIRKQELEKQISGLEREAESWRTKAKDYEKESIALSEACKKARAEAGVASADLNRQRAELAGIRKELETSRKEAQALMASAKETQEQASKTLAQVEATKQNAKEAAARAATAEAEASRLGAKNQAILDDIKDRSKRLEDLHESFRRKREEHEQTLRLDAAKIADDRDRNATSAELLAQGRKTAEAALDAANALKTQLREAVDKAVDREKTAMAQAKRLEDLYKSLEKELREIEQTKKALQVDRLRFDKLVREKNLEEELKQLRGEGK